MAVPQNKRVDYIADGLEMPVWPAKGSIRIVKDTVIVKIGPYTAPQRELICRYMPDKEPSTTQKEFCK